VTYPEAIERLRGHPDWWHYEYHGRTDLKVQAEAIQLAEKWERPTTAAAEPEEPFHPCCDGDAVLPP
jgi:hypothetical protein